MKEKKLDLAKQVELFNQKTYYRKSEKQNTRNTDFNDRKK